VADVIYGPVSSAPRLQQCRDVLLGLRIIALAPGGMVDGFLQIDNDQRRIEWQSLH
jgi:hypothetical protein